MIVEKQHPEIVHRLPEINYFYSERILYNHKLRYSITNKYDILTFSFFVGYRREDDKGHGSL